MLRTLYEAQKEHLRVNALFFSQPHSHGVKFQIRIAASVYFPVASVRKRLNLSRGLSEILWILSLNQLAKAPLDPLRSRRGEPPAGPQPANPLIVFE